MLHCPHTISGFKLTVEKVSIYNTGLKQTLTCGNTGQNIVYHRITASSNGIGTWGEWQKTLFTKHDIQFDYGSVGKPIKNIDLNDFLTEGVFYSVDGTNSATIKNCPCKTGFRLEIKCVSPGSRFQILYGNDMSIHYRRIDMGLNLYGAWQKIVTTTVS